MATAKWTMADVLLQALKDKLKTQGLPTMARASGVAKPVIWRFLKGQRGLTLATAAKLAEYLELELRPARKAGKP